jgi:DNA-binding SARP family transcriptional activator
MRFGLLGLLEVCSDGAAVPVGPGKESALPAILLLHANRPVSTDRIADELWGDRRPANATKTIQVYVSRLRKRIGAERVLTTAGGHVLVAEQDEVDVARFEQLASAGRAALDRGRPGEAVPVLTVALGLWRGPPLADFRFDAFAQGFIRRLEEIHDAAVADRIDARLALGEAEELLPELEQLVRERPLHERFRRQSMLSRPAENCGDATVASGSARDA